MTRKLQLLNSITGVSSGVSDAIPFGGCDSEGGNIGHTYSSIPAAETEAATRTPNTTDFRDGCTRSGDARWRGAGGGGLSLDPQYTR
jgi:hypothetical protein